MSSEHDAEIADLLEAIYERYHYDFRSYAPASLKRRVVNALSHFASDNVSALRARVIAEPRTFTELLRYLTVPVSDVFRDPTYYRALRELVVPYLKTYASLRVWVAGCAGGEEAYSLAILLAEEGLLERAQIYATDISEASLRTGELGIYDLERFARFSENYLAAGGTRSLSDYYETNHSSARFAPRLRNSILFSDHSLATDTAFAECQLVSCRNVLIYFNRELQDRALGVLRAALSRKGFLGLGRKETLRFTAHSDAFVDVTSEERIYQLR